MKHDPICSFLAMCSPAKSFQGSLSGDLLVYSLLNRQHQNPVALEDGTANQADGTRVPTAFKEGTANH